MSLLGLKKTIGGYFSNLVFVLQRKFSFSLIRFCQWLGRVSFTKDSYKVTDCCTIPTVSVIGPYIFEYDHGASITITSNCYVDMFEIMSQTGWLPLWFWLFTTTYSHTPNWWILASLSFKHLVLNFGRNIFGQS